MGNLLEKFEMLDATGQQQLLDYLDFLLNERRKKVKKFNYKAYRNRIVKVGTWSDEDIAKIEEARQLINEWQPKQW